MKLFISLLFYSISFIVNGQSETVAYQDSLFSNYKTQLNQALAKGDQERIAKKYLQLGNYYQSVQIHTQAIEQYHQALAILPKNFPELMATIKNGIGDSYIQLKDYPKARQFLNESKEIAESRHYDLLLASAYSMLGTSYEKENLYTQALEHQYKSLQLYQKEDDSIGIAKVNENIGSVYEDLEQYDKALQYFSISNNIFEGLQHVGRINVINNIGDVYRKTGAYKNALSYTNKALSLAHSYQDHHQIESAQKDLAKTYALIGDYKQAHEHLLVYQQLQEEGFYSQNFRQLNALQVLYDTQAKEAEIAILKQKNKLTKANQNLLMLGIALFVLLGGISFFFYNRKKQQTAKIQLYEQKLLKVELDKKAIGERKLQDEIQLKTASLSKYSLTMAQKNKMISETSITLQHLASRSSMDPIPKIKSLAKELNKSISEEQEWEEFMSFFEEIHPDFVKQLSQMANSRLSSAELRLAMLLRLNLSSKEIAAILRVTPDSVRVARYRLRKKLPIDTKQELINFMLQF